MRRTSPACGVQGRQARDDGASVYATTQKAARGPKRRQLRQDATVENSPKEHKDKVGLMLLPIRIAAQLLDGKESGVELRELWREFE